MWVLGSPVAGIGEFEEVPDLVGGPIVPLALGIDQIVSECGCCSYGGARGHMSVSQPGKEITLPGQGWALTGVSCHGNC